MRKLNYELKNLCRHNQDGSFATRAGRERTLSLIANELHEMGFRKMTAVSLKPKHVEGLVDYWKANNRSSGTIKNRMSCLRWWSQKINRSNVIAKSNDAYDIPKRQFATNTNKARDLPEALLARIEDKNTFFSLQLQLLFGLRCEESIKFIASFADQGDHLLLKSSWCKGGRKREIPISTSEQRTLLDAIHHHTGKGSLIPVEMSYKQQLDRFKHQCAKAGIDHVHGLRHAYAQSRYEELTGWKSPAQDGSCRRQLSLEQKAVDCEARLQISRELGHERESVTTTYLGR